MISTPIKINVNIFPKDQINSHHADTIILTWRDAPCVAATDSFISVGGLCETKRASVSINTYSIAPDSSSYRHTSSRRQLGAEFVIRAVLHIHHCYPITRGLNRRGDLEGDLEGAQTPSCIRGTVDVQKDAGGRPRSRSIIFNIKQPVYKVS